MNLITSTATGTDRSFASAHYDYARTMDKVHPGHDKPEGDWIEICNRKAINGRC